MCIFILCIYLFICVFVHLSASFADSGEVEGIRAVVARDGVEKLGKAEAYLYELAKVHANCRGES